MGAGEMATLGDWIADVVESPEDAKVIERVRNEVHALCQNFPAPGIQL
jgi:glycine/serine hydroxymethyltransferase